MRVCRWLLLGACMGMGGCAAIAAHYIETPGHHGPTGQFKRLLATETNYVQRNFIAPDGLRIAYWYSPPTALHIDERFSEQRTDDALRTFTFNIQFYKPHDGSAAPTLRGSVVLLHPWGQNAAQMAFWGAYFSNAGYVTVMPALRSQGDSGDAPVGYGPREANDTLQLIRFLQGRRELPGPLYLFGISYGATVALFAAPRVPDVRGVVALEPYVHPLDVILRAPATGWFAPKWWAQWFPPRTLHEAIRHADRQLGIDLASIDPGDALAASRACTLLLRGSDDILTAADAVAHLAKRSPRARYVQVPGAGHVTLFFESQRLFQPLLAWMQSIPAPATAPCPDFRLPPTHSPGTAPGRAAGTAHIR